MSNFMRFIEEPFYLMTAFAFIILLMILFLMPQPQGREWRHFRRSLNYAKIAFGIMTVLNIVQCIDPESPPHEYGIIVLIIAFYQALCFTMCFLRLLNPHSPLHQFINHLIGVSIGAVFIWGVHFLAPYFYCRIAYWVYLAAYVGTGIYYIYICRKSWFECVERVADYYDEDVYNRMLWLRRLMWNVLAIGILALVTSIWVVLNPFFVVGYTLAYAYFLICLIRYAFNAKFIIRTAEAKPVPTEAEEVKMELEEETKEMKEAEETAEPEVVFEQLNDREAELAKALEKWVEEKQFTRSDVAIEETARILGTSYSFLCSYFQSHKGITFREWRTRLRVEEAKRLLRENPSLSISDVLDMSGFNDRANFHRHFTRIVGCSPSAYRNNLKNK